MILHDP